MYFDFCIGKPEAGYARYPIDTIFYICGDETYRTPHKEVTPGKNYFVCTTRGDGLIWYDGLKFEISEGHCMLIRPTRNFGYRTKTDCWHFWWFEFVGDCSPFTANIQLDTTVNDFKIDLFTQSLSYAKEGRWDIAALLFESACEILHHAAFTAAKSPRTAQWQAAQRYIRDNLQTATVSRLCQALQMNERTLRNMFYANVGKSPKQVILKARLTAGRQLLESTALPIAEIALQLGFSSQFHFSRAFKGGYGIPPRQYRSEFSLL